MNAEVEQRIVEMRFDNEQFEKGAKQTLSTLEKLDGILNILGSGGGMDHLRSALDAMEYRFSRLGIAGSAAIQNITGKVMNLASSLLTAIPDQIVQGGTQRALNIENAKFQLKGLGIAWEEVADDIDHAVMGTAYGVDEAAKAAAILGASNVEYKNVAGQISDMGHVLRSISGIAAMTNSSYDDIANVMGDIFAMGKVTNGELQRFELRGLNVVAKLAEMSQNGTLKKIGSDAKYTETELRELISKGGIDALTFAKAMDAAFGEHATAANETYTGSLRNMKAALSRIGADFVTPFHEGERKVMLSLRGAFDRIRKITKPFAEGPFTKIVETLSDKLTKLIDSTKFGWLEKFVKLTEKINPQPITDFMDKLIGINDFLFNNKTSVGTASELLDKLKKIDISHLMPLNNSLTKAEKLKQLAEELYRLYVERGDAPDDVRDYLYFDGYIDDLTEAEKVAKFAYNALNRLAPTFSKKQFEWLLVLKDNLKSIIPTLSSAKNLFSGILSSRVLKTIGINMLLTASETIRDIAKGSKSAIDWLIQKLPIFEDFLSTLFSQLDSTYKAGKRIADAVIRLGGAVFRALFAIFEKLGQNLKSPELFNGYRDAIWKLSDSTVSVIDKITEFVNKLADLIEKGPSAESSLGKIQDAFKNLGDFVDNTKDKITNFVRSLLGIKEGQTLWERFNETVNNLKEGPLKSFGEAIRSTFGTDDSLGDKVKKVFAALIAGFFAFRKFEKAKWGVERIGRIFDLLMGQWDGLKTLANLPDKISTVFSRLSGSLRALTDNLNAKSLVEIGKAVLLMAVAIGILSLINTDKAITAIEAMMVSLLALMIALGFMTKFMKVTMSLDLVVPVILALAAALLAISIALGILSLVPTEKLIFAVMAMGAALLGLILAIQWLNDVMTLANPVKLLAAAVAVGLLAAAMVVLALAVLGFTLVPADKAANALLAMGVAITIVVVAVGMLSKLMNPLSMLAGAVALVGIAAALILVGVAINMFRGIDIKELLPMVTALMAVVLTLGLLAKFVNPLGMLAAGAALILVSGALIILAVGLRAVSYAIGKDENALIHLIGLLAVVGIALAALSTVAPMALVASLALAVAGAALLIGAAGLLVLAVALKVFEDVNIKPDYLLAIGGALVGLGIAGVIFGIGGAGLLIGGAGLLVLAIALNMMAGVKVAPDYLLALGGALAGLGIAGVIFGIGSLGLMLGGVGLILLAKGLQSMSGLDKSKLNPDYLLALGGALVGLGIAGVAMTTGLLGLMAGGEALSEFSKCLPPLAEGIKAFNGVNIKELGSLFAALSMAIPALFGLNFAAFSNVGALKDLGEALIPLAAGIKAFDEVGFWDLAKMFGGLATALGMLLGLNLANVGSFAVLASSMDLLATSIGKLPPDAADKLKGFAKAIRDNQQDPIAAMNEMLDALVKSIEAHKVPAENAMKKLIWDMCAVANSDEIRNNLRTIGGNIAIGIANGITSRTQEAANSMRRLASALQTSFTVSLQIKSPSRVFESLAEYIPMGIARGIQNGENDITDSMVSSMSGAMNLLDQYSRSSDFSPTVAPVMDMADMRRDFSYMDQMFQRSRIGSFSSFNGLTVNGDAISYNVQNRDVVGELKQMSNKINRLGQAIENMKMVLDTGVLVGQLTPGINSELGIMATREGRQ